MMASNLVLQPAFLLSLLLCNSQSNMALSYLGLVTVVFPLWNHTPIGNERQLGILPSMANSDRCGYHAP